MMDRLAAMSAFVKIIELKSFTAAADALGTTKGNVSKAISSLEAGLGAPLFNRTTRRLSLTEGGRLYLERCQRVLAEYEAAGQALTEIRTEPSGRLKLSCLVSLGEMLIAPALPSFLQAYPQIQADLVLTNRPVDLVEEGFDLCIRMHRHPPLNVVARDLARVRWATCAAPAYLEEAGEPKHPRELEAHKCLTHEPNLEREIWRFRGPAGEVRVHAAGSYRINNLEAVRIAAEAGMGIAVLPSYCIGKAIAEGRLRELHPEWKPVTLYGESIKAEYLPGRQTQPKLRAFLDFLTTLFDGEPYRLLEGTPL